jgi:hypothetical protein
MTDHPPGNVSAVTQIIPLGPQWPTIDPFLFCAHHLDRYPQGDGHLAPAADLAGREMGSDFAGKDGWNMYHGLRVPGFPQHPHRGFETITYIRRGILDHSDSLGATARFGAGDVQWLTAGSGIVHAEMFPLINTTQPNTLELFQIWLNLPASEKMVEPYFTMCWSEQQRRIHLDGVHIVVVAGRYDGYVGTAAPPDSWAARPESNLGVYHVHLEPGATWQIPAADADAARVCYVFDGGAITVDGTAVAPAHAAVLRGDVGSMVTAGHLGTDLMLLQGRPIDEPVARYGPFVMNTRAEIEQAIRDYQRTGFGGWPWPTDDPVHPADAGRFAVHPDGQRDLPPTSTDV